MPGIVGLVTKMPRERAERELGRMLESLRHEPFYQTGTWCDESLGVYVGWVARKESFADGMPLHNETGDVVLVFSGEEFPEAGTHAALRARGHQISGCGASYLVHAYEESPAAFPAALNGRFHGLVIDRRAGRAMLFNDRYGMHRVYIHESADAFYFAAEAKAILAVRPELRKADARGFGELVSLGCVLENRTLFDRIELLPGASAWTVAAGRLERKDAYFQPKEWENQPILEPEAYYERMRGVFTRTLPRYFEGHERIGMSLTGGLDTRMILAWWKAAPNSLPCYTFAGMFRDCQDVVMARRVAEACGQAHQTIPAGPDFLSQFAHYAERSVYVTDGCVDMNLCPDLYIYERARQIAPIRMSGNYGGEVLRRVRAFKPIDLLPGLFAPSVMDGIRHAKETYAGLLREHPLSFGVFKQAPWHHYGVLALEQTQLQLRTPYLDNELVRTVYQAPESSCRTDDVCLRLIADGSPALRAIRTDRGVGGNGGALSAVSRNYLEFTFKAEYAYDYGMPQWLAGIDHKLSAFHLERLFLGRHKFYHFRLWYREALASYVREMLLDPRSLSRPHVERKQVEAVVAGHLEGGRNYTLEIHKLLTLELIHRLFLDA